MQRWIIVEDMNGLMTLALAWSYECNEYKMLSRLNWCYDDENNAIEYMRRLAHDNNYSMDEKYEETFLD